MSTARYLIGDVFDRLAEIPDGSIDLVVTSPPFLALRSYLPADHPDKNKEIGSEATPADFLDTLLALSDEFARVLAPHGSICVELGDTFSGSGGGGGDYLEGGIREGQQQFAGSAASMRESNAAHWRAKNADRAAWPMAKSLTGIPTLYAWSLAYGRNMLGGRTIDPWRIRNLIVWARPNPPVGALGDKFRPATSYITVATKAQRRFFDLDAVRGEPNPKNARPNSEWNTAASNGSEAGPRRIWRGESTGGPPLDWHADDHPEDGDWLWKLSTQAYSGAHHATYPMALPERLIKAMCPIKVCQTCGKPSERIAHTTNAIGEATGRRSWRNDTTGIGAGHSGDITRSSSSAPTAERVTTGFTDCGHDDWRNGIVLDPFAGSGTTLAVASGLGRDSIGIDLDPRNADLALDRVGMFLTVEAAA